jgi:hypothetical protein
VTEQADSDALEIPTGLVLGYYGRKFDSQAPQCSNRSQDRPNPTPVEKRAPNAHRTANNPVSYGSLDEAIVGNVKVAGFDFDGEEILRN